MNLSVYYYQKTILEKFNLTENFLVKLDFRFFWSNGLDSMPIHNFQSDDFNWRLQMNNFRTFRSRIVSRRIIRPPILRFACHRTR